MKVSSINKIEEFVSNHEIWYTCKKCKREYDLRKYVKCPDCGTYYETK